MKPRLSSRRRAALLFAHTLAVAAAFVLLQPSSGNGAEPVISDNSFLVEEAYNQEAGVVQHIFGAQWARIAEGDLAATFTQEWPLGGRRHQIGATIAWAALEGDAPNGLGDVLLNYRLQLGADGAWAAAPRLSLILPTGDEDEGLGEGVLGWQANLPVSWEIGERLALHANAGITWLPNVTGRGLSVPESPADLERDLLTPFFAVSTVGPTDRSLQALLEAVVGFPETIEAGGLSDRAIETIVSPGLRAAFDLGGAQIVPGVAFPVTFVDGEDSEVGLFMYLSVEHAFSFAATSSPD